MNLGGNKTNKHNKTKLNGQMQNPHQRVSGIFTLVEALLPNQIQLSCVILLPVFYNLMPHLLRSSNRIILFFMCIRA